MCIPFELFIIFVVVPAEWSARGDRTYFISKDCDTMTGCERRQSSLASACSRDWYNDWACVDCCTGDLCNYYVTVKLSFQIKVGFKFKLNI